MAMDSEPENQPNSDRAESDTPLSSAHKPSSSPHRPALQRTPDEQKYAAILEAQALGVPTRLDNNGLVQRKAEVLAPGAPVAIMPRRRTIAAPVPLLFEPFWQPQPKESNVVFAYFATYRDMIDEVRSVKKVATVLKRNEQYLQQLCSRWRWPERARAFDVYLDVQRQMELQRSRRIANEQNVKIARAVKSKLTSRLASLDPDSLSPRDLITWFKIATEVEALALGGATSRIEVDTPDMVTERRLRDAANDVITSYKLMPDVPIDERVRWAASDYDVNLEALRTVVKKLAEGELEMKIIDVDVE